MALRSDRRAQTSAPAAELVLVGPFPVYTSVAETLLRSKRIGRAARRRGWRALILSDGAAIATVDTGAPRSHRTSSVRGPEPARALWRAVRAAHSHARARGLDPRRHELRLLEIVEAYFTAVWLPGRNAFLVPTRAGGSKRPAPRACTPDQMIQLVGRVYRQRRRRAVRPRSSKRKMPRRKGRVR
jgi:hypothetical protein